jgi:PAS domain S-box-containing protein
MNPILILDLKRGPLRQTARDLEAAGLAVVYCAGESGLAAAVGNSAAVTGVIFHHRCAALVPQLRALLDLGRVPLLVWYPRSAGPSALKDWIGAGAQDLLVGPVAAPELLARLTALAASGRAGQGWLKDAMAALRRIYATISTGADDFAVLAGAASGLEGLFAQTQCTIMMLSSRGDAGLAVIQGDRQEPLDIPVQISRYPEIQKMLQTRKPVAIRDVRRHPLMKEVRALLAAKDLVSILAVPIIHREEVIGLIMLRAGGRPRGYDQTEIGFCEMVAQTVAAALHSIRLGREIEQEIQRSRQARKLARKTTDDLARLEAIIERASDGIVVTDEAGRIKGVNVNFTRLTGLTKDDVEGRAIDDIIAPASGERATISQVLADPEHYPRRANRVLVTKAGLRKQLAVRLERMPRRREWLISLHDVTEERELEEALRRTKDFLAMVIQSSMDAIIAADMKGSIILFNEAAERISNHPADEVIGKMNIIEFYAPGVARDIMRKLRSTDYGGRGKLETCYNTIVNKNGDEVPINMSASIIYEDGREVASVGIFQDLRERIGIEKELRQAQEQLMVSQQKEAIMALSGAASHQLNQPLTSILGYAELLKRVERTLAAELPQHPAVASLHNASEIIGQESERMAEVVRKIGEVSEFKTVQYVGGARIMDLEAARGAAADRNLAVWNAVFHFAKEAVLVFGEDTVVRSANPASVVMTGENPVGKSFTRYLRGIEYTRAMEALQRAKNGELVELDIEVILPGERPATFHAFGLKVPQTDEYMLIYSDVTATKKLEEELKELHAFHDRILKTTTLPMVSVDLDGKINFWNQAAEKFFGYSADEVRGKIPDFIIPDYTDDAFFKFLDRVRQEGDVAQEFRLTTKAGLQVKVYHVATAMRDEDNEPVGILSMIFDLSEQQAFERELQEKTGQIALMAQIVEALRTKVGLEQALGEVLRQLARMFPVDLGAIVIDDESSHSLLVISYDHGRDQFFKNTLRLYEDSDTVRRLLFQERPAIYDNLDQIQLNFASGDIVRELGALRDKGLKSVMTFPLSFQDVVLGALHLISSEAGRYTQSDLDRLAQVAGPVTMALANARLFHQIELQNLELVSRNAWMEGLIRASQGLSVTMRLEDLSRRLIKPYSDAHPWQHLSVWYAPPGGPPALIAAHNYQEDGIRGALILPPALLVRLRDQGETLDLSIGAGHGYEPLLPDAENALLVPLVALDQWLGMIILESHHVNAFHDEEKVEVQVLAAQLAGALRNSQVCNDLDLSLRFREGLFEDANALILVLDREGRIELINRALEDLIELPGQTFTGSHFRRLFKDHLRIRTGDGEDFMTGDEFRRLIAAIERGEKLANLRASVISASGREHLAVFNTSSILDRNGAFSGFIAIGQNITQYRDLQQHLLHAEKLATVGQMAAGVAHELSNPLTAIVNAADILARLPGCVESGQAVIEQMKEQARRIETLVQNLMSYSRPSSAAMFPLQLSHVVADSLSFSKYELSRGRVTVESQVPADLPPIRGIKDQIQQVFINLLTNASHACAEKGGGRIVINARPLPNDMVEVRVVDDGPGISPENLRRVFEPFFTTKPEGKGTGLGLFIVKDIITRHRGTISVESKAGEGAAFIITLPVYTLNNNQ